MEKSLKEKEIKVSCRFSKKQYLCLKGTGTITSQCRRRIRRLGSIMSFSFTSKTRRKNTKRLLSRSLKNCVNTEAEILETSGHKNEINLAKCKKKRNLLCFICILIPRRQTGKVLLR